MNALCQDGTRRDRPFGIVAVALSFLLVGLCAFLPVEIQIGGALTFVSPMGVALIAVCALLGMVASVGALSLGSPAQKLLGVAAAVISAWVLTVAATSILKYLPG